jgi:hypothetical protein
VSQPRGLGAVSSKVRAEPTTPGNPPRLSHTRLGAAGAGGDGRLAPPNPARARPTSPRFPKVSHAMPQPADTMSPTPANCGKNAGSLVRALHRRRSIGGGLFRSFVHSPKHGHLRQAEPPTGGAASHGADNPLPPTLPRRSLTGEWPYRLRQSCDSRATASRTPADASRIPMWLEGQIPRVQPRSGVPGCGGSNPLAPTTFFPASSHSRRPIRGAVRGNAHRTARRLRRCASARLAGRRGTLATAFVP